MSPGNEFESIAENFNETLIESFYTMANVSVLEIPEPNDHDYDPDETAMIICGLIIIVIKSGGVAAVSLSMAEGTAKYIYSQVLGDDLVTLTPDSTDYTAKVCDSYEELSDCICEIINLTAGMVKANISFTEQTYTLLTPLGITGSRLKIIPKAGIDGYSKRYRITNGTNDGIISLDINLL